MIFLSLSMWAHRKKAVICKPGREFLPEPGYTGTLILDVHSPELWENKWFILSHSSYDILLQWPKQTKTESYDYQVLRTLSKEML